MGRCPICFSHWQELLPDIPAVTSLHPSCIAARHIFCLACFLNLLETSKKCPLCREDIPGNEYQKFDLKDSEVMEEETGGTPGSSKNKGTGRNRKTTIEKVNPT